MVSSISVERDSRTLLEPTLHIEVQLSSIAPRATKALEEVRQDAATWLANLYERVAVGQDLSKDFRDLRHGECVKNIDVVDYTGPEVKTGYHQVAEVHLDVQTYVLNHGIEIAEIMPGESQHILHARILRLPHVALSDAWGTLVFDDRLPARVLRYLTRMFGLTRREGLNLSTFNWNRLCLLHGPPGSGKSTLCRALAQKLSIRLSEQFSKAHLVELNANAMLSKYFGESGKLIGATFEQIRDMAQDASTLVVVVMDEIETIAGSRQRSALGFECNDGLRATNQLLMALDSLRLLSNIIVLCTSNLLDAIDMAFVDRADIKQYVPCPSPAAIYNIFRSGLNELMRSGIIQTTPKRAALLQCEEEGEGQVALMDSSSRRKRSKRGPTDMEEGAAPPSSTAPCLPRFESSHDPIATYAEMQSRLATRPDTASRRVWALAQKCLGFSGRTLRRLPVQGLAMHTWGPSTLDDAVAAIEAAIEQELLARGGRNGCP